jgi:hypothetical protein
LLARARGSAVTNKSPVFVLGSPYHNLPYANIGSEKSLPKLNLPDLVSTITSP